jgi:hypothetical protein
MGKVPRFSFVSFYFFFFIFPFVNLFSPPLDPDPPPPRQATVTETYTQLEWWLLKWSDNELVCRFFTGEEEQPNLNVIQSNCTEEVFRIMVDQPICDAATYGGDLSSCSGLYLYLADSRQAERQVVVDLLPVTVTLSLKDCVQVGYKIACTHIPELEIGGIEPLSDQHITQVHYQYRSQNQVCQGAVCTLTLWPTTTYGEPVSFSAVSSFGDSSELFQARYRVRTNGDGSWEVDVLSDQLPGIRMQAMSLAWQAFPPLEKNPSWLSYPEGAAGLATALPYQYLAGQLIRMGIVDASACADNGTLQAGYASQCGLEQAMEKVIEWQNRFDATIFTTAERFDLSPRLLKNIIARESQFWPGMNALSPLEYGLARLMETGADTLFRWNDSFYASFCNQILWDEACAGGYNNLAKVDQEMLRGALATQVNVYCEGCAYGFDLERVDYGIEVLAQSLLANGAQVEQMFENLTGEPAGVSAGYEDLWRFTLVNYNAGPGCLGAALQATQKGGAQFTWDNVARNLVGGCRDAIVYVENIAK